MGRVLFYRPRLVKLYRRPLWATPLLYLSRSVSLVRACVPSRRRKRRGGKAFVYLHHAYAAVGRSRRTFNSSERMWHVSASH